MHFWQHVDQKLWLRAIVRRVAVDFEEAGQAVNQVIDRGCVVGTILTAAPLVEKQTIAFVLLKWGSIENAQNIVLHPYCFYLLGPFTRCAPIQSIDVL